MATYNLLGKNFVPPDVHGKVTGKAKYAEDFRAEGMAFCRLMLSPMPHARVRNIDMKEALAMPGVLGILTAKDVPAQPPPGEPILTDEPMYVGQPILAVAAVDETTAQDAIDKIKLDLEELPFTVDPLQSLFPGGPDARTDGNVIDNRLIGPPKLTKAKWTAADFAKVEEGQLPLGEPVLDWSYGDVEAGLQESRARARRDVRDGHHVSPFDGAALRDGVLGKRQVLRVWLHAEPEFHRAGRSLATSASSPKIWSMSRKPAAAASARKAPRIRRWRYRPTCRRRSASR